VLHHRPGPLSAGPPETRIAAARAARTPANPIWARVCPAPCDPG
jgi:hypothetical protein